MEELSCLVSDHEMQNKLIEGICIDEKCEAQQRIWCVICQSKYHRKCNRDSLLLKEEVIHLLKERENKLNAEYLNSGLYEFKEIKSYLIKQLERLENLFKKKETISSLPNYIQDIHRLLANPLSQQSWNEIYFLITANLLDTRCDDQQILKNNLKKISSILIESESLLLNQEQKQFQSEWGINERMVSSDQNIWAMDCSPDGKHIAYSDFNLIRIYDPKIQMKIGKDLIGHKEGIWTIKYSVDGKILASGSGGLKQNTDCTIRVWNTMTQTQLQILQGHQAPITSVQFSPDGEFIVSGSMDKTLRIWNWRVGKQFGNNLTGHKNWVRAVDYSPNGQYVVSGSSDRSIIIWGAQNGQQFRQLNGHESQVMSVQYSLDGELLVSAGNDYTIRIWNLINGEQLSQKFIGHTDCIWSVAFSTYADFIVSSSSDNTIRIWKARTGEQVGILNQRHNNGCSANFHVIVSSLFLQKVIRT